MNSMDDFVEPIDPRKRKVKIWLIVSQLIAASFLAPWLCIASFASMIGWPGVITAQGGWDFLAFTFALMLYYPLLAIIPITISWFLYTRRLYNWAAILSFLPILLFSLAVLLWLVAGGGSAI